MKKRSEHKIKAKKWPWEYSYEEFSLQEDIISYLTRRYGESSVARKVSKFKVNIMMLV